MNLNSIAEKPQPGTFLFLITLLLFSVAWLSLLRLLLLVYNQELAADVPATTLLESILLGVRFDASALAYVFLPLSLLVVLDGKWPRRVGVSWLVACLSGFTFLGLMELEFYREFQQRLNNLVFVYLEQDPATVISMLWNGYPVVTLTTIFLLGCLVIYWVVTLVDIRTRAPGDRSLFGWVRLVGVVLCIVLMGRGILGGGAPLRWGDAYQFDYPLANHLALNGAKTLLMAGLKASNDEPEPAWTRSLSQKQALRITRSNLMLTNDVLIDQARAAIRRKSTPFPVVNAPSNIIVILMESFSGQFVGALGSDLGITPNFDKLATRGLLFNRFFSNGTHTHQGIFATLSCFPNLPGYEYLMQQAEGQNRLSGIANIQRIIPLQNLYVYNGDFRWDNQAGFFRNQGMNRFVGRHDYVNPKLEDETWGVSDEDMFDRALVELGDISDKPFFAVLQTLSNHVPYNLPQPLPFERPLVEGALGDRLTAMKYSDWALGQFMDAALQSPFFANSTFVILGDHGFGVASQVTDINLLRFHVPMLIISRDIPPGIQSSIVGSQVDIVPTALGFSGEPFEHQCWGRNLMEVTDQGFAMIKPSGGEQMAAFVEGKNIFTFDPLVKGKLYEYDLGTQVASQVNDKPMLARMKNSLLAYVQVATDSLLSNTAGP